VSSGGVRVIVDDDDDEETIQECLARLYPSMRRFAAVVAPREVAPDDLLHDALVALLRSAHGQIDDPGAYLRRTMLNLASNHRRRFGRARRASDRLGAGAPDGATDHYPSDLGHLAALRPEARAVLYLRHVERLPLPLVAEELGLGYAATRQIAARARRALRQHIEQEEY
jgi:DNA-directed RNA polymerase specialized sigma24 family protein